MAPRIALALVAAALASAPAVAQTVYYVDADATGAETGASWVDAFTDLQDALDVVGSEEEVWIAEGVYLPDRGTGDRDATFRVDGGVELYGGFEGGEQQVGARDPQLHPTILSGDLAGDDAVGGGRDDNAHHVLTIDDAFAIGARLNGLVIEGGEALGADQPDGGGLMLLGGGPTLREVVFRGNRAAGGGAIWLAGISQPTLIDCDLIDNHAVTGAGGAILATDNGGGSIADSRFLGNTSALDGGAVELVEGSTMAFNNTVFSGNVAGGTGGALSVDSDDMVLQACTLAYNRSGSDGGGGVSVEVGLSLVQATILWGNQDGNGLTDEAAQLIASPGAEVFVDECDIQGYTGVTFPGFSNMDADPEFVDPFGPDGVAGTPDDDHRLKRISPCIDSGPPLGSGTFLDILEFPRRLDGDLDGLMASDVGAHEFCHARLELPRVVHAGETFELTMEGTPGMPAQLCVSASTAAGFFIPYGAVTFAFSSLITRLDVGTTPVSLQVHVPETIVAPEFVVIQGLVLSHGGATGNFTNGPVLWIEP